MLEKLSTNFLLGKIDMEFRSYLRAWCAGESKRMTKERKAYEETLDGEATPDYREPETQQQKIINKRNIKRTPFVRALQKLKDKRNAESDMLLSLIHKETLRRAELKHTPAGREALAQWKQEQIDNIVSAPPGSTKTYFRKKQK